MYAKIMTRGRSRGDDYSYFPPVTGDSWWRRYRDETSFEHPTLLLEAGQGVWRLYAGGIPSDRRDSTGTRIRYSYILAGDSTDRDDVSTAQFLVWIWSRAGGREDLGHIFDQWATEETVAEWFQSSGSVPSANDVLRAVTDAIRQTSEGIVDPPSADTGTLELPNSGDVVGTRGSRLARVGGLASSDGTHTLRTAATSLLRGEMSGCALVLNLVNFSRQQPSEDLRKLVSPLGPYTLILDMSSSEPIRDVLDWAVRAIGVMPDPKVTRLRPTTGKIVARRTGMTRTGMSSIPSVLYQILFKKLLRRFLVRKRRR